MQMEITPMTRRDNPHSKPGAVVDSERWRAVVDRDPKADGAFWYAVKTTGVFCRPSCAARLPKRENVTFHASLAEAEAAGFRPCRRCRPTEPALAGRQADAVARACRLLEEGEETPSLDAVAAAVAMSRFHFQRVFRKITGLTPKAWAREHRAGRLRDALRVEPTVTDALYAAGFNSSSRFYESADRMLGMKPRAFRSGAPDTTLRFAVGECSLGVILVAATDKGVCSILFGDTVAALETDLRRRFPKAEIVAGDRTFARTVRAVIRFVEAPRLGLDLPLDLRGTAFQRRVWTALREIRAGSTASYAEVAARIGAPGSARAVAQACAANALAVAVPCHRVVHADGSLSGYRWGVERKRTLLERESRPRARPVAGSSRPGL